MQEQLNAEHRRLLEIAELAAKGETVYGRQLTKKEQAIMARFKRDHEVYADLVQTVFVMGAHEYLSEMLAEERRDLARREAELKENTERLWGHNIRAIQRDIDLDLVKRLRAFLHPDKHVGCPSEGKAHDLGVELAPLVNELTLTMKAREAHALEKQRRSEAAKRGAATRKKAKTGGGKCE